MQELKKSIQLGGQTLSIETGCIARQASGAVIVDLDGTSVLVTVVGAKDSADERDFFPLRVDYQEKYYASGKIPGGYFKREGRPSEREILVARLIDRPLRPLFPEKYFQEVQVVATVMSVNPEVEPDVPAMIGASAALAIAGLPVTKTMGASRVGFIDGCYVLNPTTAQLKKSKLDLVVAGSKDSVLMVESEAKELSEEVMLGAVTYGHKGFQPVIEMIEEMAKESGVEVWNWTKPEVNSEARDGIKADFEQRISDAYLIESKLERQDALKAIKEEANEKYVSEEKGVTSLQVNDLVAALESNVVRGRLIRGEMRMDGRTKTTVRPITIKTSALPRTHGSAVFTRGETQAFGVLTLGPLKEAQILDSVMGEEKEYFMLHYNFPPYSVGEIGMVGSPKRREIGHGRLARRSIAAVLPSHEEFRYAMRMVSEITESNGSSSMASVCVTSLALMNAGVPIKSHVAGIAMGLVKEGDEYVVMSDISGSEDKYGDMDFKVAGTREGVSALQMDIKIPGITEDIMKDALEQAREGRLHILGKMESAISAPSKQLSEFAPRILTMKISSDKIKDVIGKGGATIKGLIEETGVSIDISDNGIVEIATNDQKSAELAKQKIEDLTAEAEVGEVYVGKVIKIVDFGAFINILPGKDGLLHISQISKERVENVNDKLSVGEEVSVKLIDIDKQGRLKLSIKALSEEQSNAVRA